MEDKLNAILNDPSAMGQIMALAQSLGGGAPRPQASPGGGGRPGAEADRRQGGGGARFGGERSAGPGGGRGPAGRPGGDRPRHDPDGDAAAAGVSGEDDRTVALLNALRPFLKESRLAKLDRAVQISRLARVIRVLFRGMGEGGGAMYNRYIPPEWYLYPGGGAGRPGGGPGVRHPIRPGRSGGRTGPGPAGPPPGAARGAPGGGGRRPAPGPMGFGGLGDLLSGGEEPAERPVRRGQGGINGILKVLRLEELDSGDILLILDHPAPAGGGGTTWTWSSPWGCCSAGAGG